MAMERSGCVVYGCGNLQQIDPPSMYCHEHCRGNIANSTWHCAKCGDAGTGEWSDEHKCLDIDDPMPFVTQKLLDAQKPYRDWRRPPIPTRLVLNCTTYSAVKRAIGSRFEPLAPMYWMGCMIDCVIGAIPVTVKFDLFDGETEKSATPPPTTLHAQFQDQIIALALKVGEMEKEQALHADELDALEQTCTRLSLESRTGDAKIEALERRMRNYSDISAESAGPAFVTRRRLEALERTVYGPSSDPPLGLLHCVDCGVKFRTQAEKREHYKGGCGGTAASRLERVARRVEEATDAVCSGTVTGNTSTTFTYSSEPVPWKVALSRPAPSPRPGWFASARRWINEFNGNTGLVHGTFLGGGVWALFETAANVPALWAAFR